MEIGAYKTYQDECHRLRMHLVSLLARPAFGHRSWSDEMLIGEALIELDRLAEKMDREANLHNPRTDEGQMEDSKC